MPKRNDIKNVARERAEIGGASAHFFPLLKPGAPRPRGKWTPIYPRSLQPISWISFLLVLFMMWKWWEEEAAAAAFVSIIAASFCVAHAYFTTQFLLRRGNPHFASSSPPCPLFFRQQRLRQRRQNKCSVALRGGREGLYFFLSRWPRTRSVSGAIHFLPWPPSLKLSIVVGSVVK